MFEDIYPTPPEKPSKRVIDKPRFKFNLNQKPRKTERTAEINQ